VSHGIVDLTASAPETQSLLTEAATSRRASQHNAGLTVIGSHPFYSGDDKVLEDATELVAMHLWSPDYLTSYVNFLADRRYDDYRSQIGLARVADPSALTKRVALTVDRALVADRAAAIAPGYSLE